VLRQMDRRAIVQLQEQVFTDWAVNNMRLFGSDGKVKSAAKKSIDKEMRAVAKPAIRELKDYYSRMSDMPTEMQEVFAAFGQEQQETALLTRDEGARWPVLEELKKGTEVDQLRAALIETHLGLPGGLPVFRTQGQRERAQQDAAEYHGLTSAPEGLCPTCAYIAKHARFPGVNPISLGSLMEWWAFTRQARTPVVVG